MELSKPWVPVPDLGSEDEVGHSSSVVVWAPFYENLYGSYLHGCFPEFIRSSCSRNYSGYKLCLCLLFVSGIRISSHPGQLGLRAWWIRSTGKGFSWIEKAKRGAPPPPQVRGQLVGIGLGFSNEGSWGLELSLSGLCSLHLCPLAPVFGVGADSGFVVGAGHGTRVSGIELGPHRC